jgi:hypothetical protein
MASDNDELTRPQRVAWGLGSVAAAALVALYALWRMEAGNYPTGHDYWLGKMLLGAAFLGPAGVMLALSAIRNRFLGHYLAWAVFVVGAAVGMPLAWNAP